MSTEAEARAERIAVKRGRGHATKQRCQQCDGKNRASHLVKDALAGGETDAACSRCEGYGYVYLIGKSGEPRSVPQLLGLEEQT